MKLLVSILTAAAFAGLFLAVAAPAGEDTPPVPPTGVEVQTRGQVHEAFAEATQTRGAPGVIVGKQPPDPIDEVPPDQKPEGENIIWVPGYWAWNDDDRDFIWISGFWRAVPPGRTWVPGTWQKVDNGWQWVSGYWGVEDQRDEVQYLPTPPESIDNGPSVPAPTADCSYVPGCWVYRVNRYLWRPGCWIPFRPGWCWTAACHRWTPAGYLYVDGFWDLPLCNRGLLFAPVRFLRPLYLARGFEYRPAFVVQPDFLLGALFVRTGTHHYYFGDYFAAGHRKRFIPWIDYRVNRYTHDTNFNYYRVAYARHPEWERNLRTLYTGRSAGTIPRPPQTLGQQTKAIDNFQGNKLANAIVHKNVPVTHLENVRVVQPLSLMKTVVATGMARLAATRPTEVRKSPMHREFHVAPVRKEQIAVEKRHVERIRAVALDRRKTEVHLAARTPVHKVTAPVKAKVILPRTVAPPRVIHPPVKPPPPPVRPPVVVRPHPPIRPVPPPPVVHPRPPAHPAKKP